MSVCVCGVHHFMVKGPTSKYNDIEATTTTTQTYKNIGGERSVYLSFVYGEKCERKSQNGIAIEQCDIINKYQWFKNIKWNLYDGHTYTHAEQNDKITVKCSTHPTSVSVACPFAPLSTCHGAACIIIITHTHIIFGSQKNAHNNSRKFIIVYAQCGHVNSNDSIRIFKTFECFIVNAERVDCFGKCKQKPTWQQNSHTVLINMDSGWSRKRAKISAYIVYCRGEIRLAQCVAPCVCVSDTHE